jgi:protoheme IX farnesyltransferase
MTTESNLRRLNAQEGLQPPLYTSLRVFVKFCVLTKPDINLLVAFTVLAGFCLAFTGYPQPFPVRHLINTLIGTFLVAGGSCALNHYVERPFDACMRRTARRPLVSGDVKPDDAFWFGILLSSLGLVYLALAVNSLVTVLAGLASAIYLFAYTPLKRKTPLCTFVGALSGAIPPLIGWAAASGSLSLEAWGLYTIVFLWQFPHFMAIAWIYREDYARAGYYVLPVGKRQCQTLEWQILIPLSMLIPVESAFKVFGFAGWTCVTGMLILTFAFLCYGARLVLKKNNAAARQLLFSSLLYLPSVLFLLMFDKA